MASSFCRRGGWQRETDGDCEIMIALLTRGYVTRGSVDGSWMTDGASQEQAGRERAGTINLTSVESMIFLSSSEER